MAESNLDRVGKALELLNEGLRPFVEREMKAVLGDRWTEVAQQSFREGRAPATKAGKLNWDTQALLTVVWDQWNEVFKKTLGRAERTLVSELRDVRNRWAHQEAFSTDDAYRALDSIARLLTAVSAPESDEIEKQKQKLLRVRFEEQGRQERRRVAAAPVAGTPSGGLKPWREIVTPHPDVASGRYQQAEFAADLWQVYLGEGGPEYKKPTEFYRRTYLTEGLQGLLVGSLRRLTGKGGDPVIELQTNFGGGKTHSLLALYHLFSGGKPSELPGLEPILEEVGISDLPKTRRVVLVGTKISPGKLHSKEDGTKIRTLWGELAWQLGGKKGYSLVKEADETATNPGDDLRKLFTQFGPCLILIDEWVAYARQLYNAGDLPAGSFDTHFTFAQALTEAAKASPETLLVVSIPVSDNEIGGEGGKAALERLKNAIHRVESPWRPASADEGFEIVRRRLFEPISDPTLFSARDAVVRAFSDLYRTQQQEFPPGCREGEYEERMKRAYPIHPELFDRLYKDWSTLDRFQQTRGVLRLMAAVIHSLWQQHDRSLLILPANIPIADSAVQSELTSYLEDQWRPVIEKDVDGPGSVPLRLDGGNPNLGRYSASRRVARTIYMGSAPTFRAAHRGLDDRQMKLGCVQPGEAVATFGDALRHLTDQSTFLYVDGQRYWYSTQASVTRLAEGRAQQVKPDDAAEEIRRRVREQSRSRGEFARVHAFASSSADVPDEQESRLVILGPEYAHSARGTDTLALREAKGILETRGTGPRLHKNTLVFLVADRARLSDLETAVRQYLAWKSIEAEEETLNLDAFQRNQARAKSKNADETVDARIPETYQWLLVPVQANPAAQVEWQEKRLQGPDPLAVRAAKKLRQEELLVTSLGGTRLRLELDRVPLWRADHVSLKQLAEDFAQYLYLPRLKGPEVLQEAAVDGLSLLTWRSETFAYAEGKDESRSRYRGLRAGEGIRVSLSAESLLVRPEVAARQIDEDRAKAKAASGEPPDVKEEDDKAKEEEPSEVLKRRFHGSVTLDATRLGRDAGKVAEEVVQHLTGLVGARVEVVLEIHAEIPDGAPEQVVRTVTENCRTLKFREQGFEEK